MVVQEREWLVGTTYERIEPPAVTKTIVRLRRVLQRFINTSARETAAGFREIEEGNYCSLGDLKEKAGVN